MNPCNLILHCGAHAVPRTDLDLVRTPTATDTWQPIPHSAYLAHVESTLPAHGLRVVNEAHALTHDGGRYFGLLQVQNGHNHPDYTWVLGLRNSHDKTLPAGLVAGSSVFVCDNLAFSGEIEVSRKHTSFILRDLPMLVREALSRLVGKWFDQDRRIAKYQDYRLTDADAHDLTIRALDSGAITNRMIPDVLEEWRHPRHEAFQPRNTWSWFNACTERLKGHLHLLPERTRALYDVCDEFTGMLPN
jgi:hypothetical protein